MQAEKAAIHYADDQRRGREDSSLSRRRSVDSITGATAYPTGGVGATDDDVPEWGRDYGSKSKKPSKKAAFTGIGKKKKATGTDMYTPGAGAGGASGGWASNGGYADEMQRDDGWGGQSQSSGREASRRDNGGRAAAPSGGSKPGKNGDPNWEHEF